MLDNIKDNKIMSWQTLSNGILLKNGDDGLNTLAEIYDADIAELGYNRNEVYPKDNYTTKPMIIGYFKLLTNELIAIHRDDYEMMYEFEIDDWKSELFEMMDYEEEDILKNGILNRTISQAYIENVCGQKAKSNTLDNGKYTFTFRNGFLVDFRSSGGLSASARDFLDTDAYIKEAEKWYHGNMGRIIREVNLQAECMMNTDKDIILSSVNRRKFSYPNGYCNFIAMAAHFKSYDIDLSDVIDSLHGDYEVVEKSSLYTKIRAYGEIFTKVIDKNDDETNAEYEEAENSSFGYVYVMINPSLPNLVKIGKTSREPNERAKELSSATGVPTPFILVYYKPFRDCNLAESVVHHFFEEKGARVNGNREFFQVSPTEAIDLINLYFKMEQEKYGE